ncbi:hypothetical protein Tco_1527142, partial [Tanacetum coccineum]
TNGAVNTVHGATTASTQANTVNSTTIDNLSDAVICAFFASQPNSLQLDNEDLQQIYPDDLEEMDLRCPRWSVTTATKGGRFTKECRAPRNQENKNRENTRRVVPVKTTTSNALVSCDGSGYYWSDQAEEGPTNFALMAYSFISSNSESISEPIVIKPIVEKSEAKASEAKPKTVRKDNDAPIIEDWVLDSEEENVS